MLIREKVKCKKNPHFPSHRCQNVPRLDKLWKKVPEERTFEEFHKFQRIDCENKQIEKVSYGDSKTGM